VGGNELGAETQFRAFVIAHQDTLLRVALLLTTDRGHAEDLVQTALMRTYARWDRLHNEDPFGYARRIIVNANVDRWRKDRGREYLTDTPPDAPGMDIANRIAERDLLLRALKELPIQERRVIILRFLADLSEADTATELGIPLGTVKSATHRAIRRLRATTLFKDTNEVTP
jgi:RNA polymerase sigma-70 factor (sigma-E family)